MKIFKEFKEFISRGSVIDLAVGVIIGAAFSAIVTALVSNIFMPIIGLFVSGGLDNFYTILTSNSILAEVQDGTVGVLAKDGQYYTALSKIDWGAFINAVLNFLLIALILFGLIKLFASIKKASDLAMKKFQKSTEEEPEPEPEPEPDPQLVLLTEIRDLLKKDEPKK